MELLYAILGMNVVAEMTHFRWCLKTSYGCPRLQMTWMLRKTDEFLWWQCVLVKKIPFITELAVIEKWNCHGRMVVIAMCSVKKCLFIRQFAETQKWTCSAVRNFFVLNLWYEGKRCRMHTVNYPYEKIQTCNTTSVHLMARVEVQVFSMFNEKIVR